MEDFGCFWDYQETVDELKQKVLIMTYDLETTRRQANEEVKKNKEKLLQLLNLLQVAYRERDEAKDQLKRLLNQNNKLSSINGTFCNNNFTTTTAAAFAPLSPESPLLMPTTTKTTAGTGCNSSTTASNSPSVDSFFDSPAVSSPDLSTFIVDSAGANNHTHNATTATTSNSGLNFINHQQQQQPTLVQDFSTSLPPLAPTMVSTEPTTTPRTNKIDQASLIISSLAKGRPLPQKGRLLQAVMEAGPLLSTLIVAGPLPRWRNPPPTQTLQIPQFDSGSHGPSHLGSPATAKRSFGSMNNSSGHFGQISCGGLSQMHQNNMLNFAGSGSNSSMMAAGGFALRGNNGRTMMTMMSGSSGLNTLINNQISSMPKRQRIQ